MIGANVAVKGSILLYRVFDIAHEVDLSAAETLFQEGFARGRFKFFRDPHKSLIIEEAPLIINLGNTSLKTPAGQLTAVVNAKIWNYGALSLTLEVVIPENYSWKQLVGLGAFLDGAEEVNEIAINQKKIITKNILPSLKDPNKDWEVFEDYTTYILEEVLEQQKTEKTGKEEEKTKTVVYGPEDILKKCAIAELINAEETTVLSPSTKKSFTNNFFQYSKDDLLILDWNSALLVDLSKDKNFRDYADIIEFSLTHSLSLRRYDYLLDQKLKKLYDSLDVTKNKSLFSNYYGEMLEDINRSYMEYSEFFERINNSLKTVGDYYLATIFRAASKKFRFEDWQQATGSKMKTLDHMAGKINNELNSRRGHFLELTIVVMIGIELIPMLYSWGVRFITHMGWL